MATVGEQTIQSIISNHTKDKATKAKITLENYYSNLVAQHEERENRYSKIGLCNEGLNCDCAEFIVW